MSFIMKTETSFTSQTHRNRYIVILNSVRRNIRITPAKVPEDISPGIITAVKLADQWFLFVTDSEDCSNIFSSFFSSGRWADVQQWDPKSWLWSSNKYWSIVLRWRCLNWYPFFKTHFLASFIKWYKWLQLSCFLQYNLKRSQRTAGLVETFAQAGDVQGITCPTLLVSFDTCLGRLPLEKVTVKSTDVLMAKVFLRLKVFTTLLLVFSV